MKMEVARLQDGRRRREVEEELTEMVRGAMVPMPAWMEVVSKMNSEGWEEKRRWLAKRWCLFGDEKSQLVDIGSWGRKVA